MTFDQLIKVAAMQEESASKKKKMPTEAIESLCEFARFTRETLLEKGFTNQEAFELTKMIMSKGIAE